LLWIWGPTSLSNAMGGWTFISLRCAGVIRFNFHVLQLLPIRFTQQNLCCKSMMKHQQKPNWKSNPPPYLVLVMIWKLHICWLLTWIHRSSQLCSLWSAKLLIMIFEDVVQSLLNVCIQDVCSLILAKPHTNWILETH
jgi:hypothetical protein